MKPFKIKNVILDLFASSLSLFTRIMSRKTVKRYISMMMNQPRIEPNIVQ